MVWVRPNRVRNLAVAAICMTMLVGCAGATSNGAAPVAATDSPADATPTPGSVGLTVPQPTPTVPPEAEATYALYDDLSDQMGVIPVPGQIDIAGQRYEVAVETGRLDPSDRSLVTTVAIDSTMPADPRPVEIKYIEQIRPRLIELAGSANSAFDEAGYDLADVGVESLRFETDSGAEYVCPLADAERNMWPCFEHDQASTEQAESQE